MAVAVKSSQRTPSGGAWSAKATPAHLTVGTPSSATADPGAPSSRPESKSGASDERAKRLEENGRGGGGGPRVCARVGGVLGREPIGLPGDVGVGGEVVGREGAFGDGGEVGVDHGLVRKAVVVVQRALPLVVDPVAVGVGMLASGIYRSRFVAVYAAPDVARYRARGIHCFEGVKLAPARRR